MADTKVSALTSATPVGTDELYLVDDPGGTPSSKRATVASVLAIQAATLASTSNGDGAALIGIEDSGGLITATTVEGALAEIQGSVDTVEAALPSGDVVGTTDTQTLSGKTIDSASNTLTVDLSEATVTGTTSEFNTALSDGSFATLAGTETLTNKTLTTPIVSHNVRTDADNYTLVAGDANGIVLMSGGSANQLTIPTNASVAFATGTKVEVWSTGAGTTTIAGDTGVTLQGNGGSASAGSCDIQTQYGGATLTKIATNTWMVGGDIDVVS